MINSNVRPGETADIVIVMGHDSPGQNFLQAGANNLRAECERKGLKYAILGDGRSPVDLNLVTRLPKSHHAIVYGHGLIENGRHTIGLSKTGPNSSMKVLQSIQLHTGAQKMAFCSCFGGKVNHDIAASKQAFTPGTEIIIPAASDSVTLSIHCELTALSMIRALQPNNPTSLRMPQLFAELMKQCPETMSLSRQTNTTFERLTIRREHLAAKGEPNPRRYLAYNMRRLNAFVKKTSRRNQSINTPDMTPQEEKEYLKNSFLNHVSHFEGDVLLRLIELNPAVFPEVAKTAFSYALGSITLMNNAFAGITPHAVKSTLIALIRYAPQELAAVFNDPNFFHPAYTERNAALYNILIKILHDPHALNWKGDEYALNTVKQCMQSKGWPYQEHRKIPSNKSVVQLQQFMPNAANVPAAPPPNPSTQKAANPKAHYTPPNVETRHLHANGKLLDDASIALAKQQLMDPNKHTIKMQGSLIMRKKAKGISVQKFKDPTTGQERYFAMYLGAKHKEFGKHGKALGAGYFGKVKLMQDLETGTWYALKSQNIAYHDAARIGMAQKEFHNLNIRKDTLGSMWMNKNGQYRFMVAMKLAPGKNLHETFIADRTKHIPDDVMLRAGRNIAAQFNIMHKQGLVHCDIKSDNINIDSNYEDPSILDMGLATPPGVQITQKGAVVYLAPELQHSNIATPAVDVYALALTFCEIYGMAQYVPHGTPPNVYQYPQLMSLNNPQLAHCRIANPQLRQELWNLLNSGLNPDPAQRPTMQQLSQALNTMSQRATHRAAPKAVAATQTITSSNTSINTQDANGDTKLHQVLNSYQRSNFKSVINKVHDLLNQGADVHLKNNAGKSAYDIFLEIEKKVKRHKDPRQWTAIQALKQALNAKPERSHTLDQKRAIDAEPIIRRTLH